MCHKTKPWVKQTQKLPIAAEFPTILCGIIITVNRLHMIRPTHFNFINHSDNKRCSKHNFCIFYGKGSEKARHSRKWNLIIYLMSSLKTCIHFEMNICETAYCKWTVEEILDMNFLDDCC